jgi:hypothetical protein
LAVSGFEIDDELEIRPVRTSPGSLGFERKPLWVSDDFFAQINIEIGPIEMARLVARPFRLELSIIRARLSGNDVNHALHLLELGLPYVKDHFDSVVPISRYFKKEARSTELNRT